MHFHFSIVVVFSYLPGIFISWNQNELDGVSGTLGSAESKTIKLAKDLASVESHLQDTQVHKKGGSFKKNPSAAGGELCLFQGCKNKCTLILGEFSKRVLEA